MVSLTQTSPIHPDQGRKVVAYRNLTLIDGKGRELLDAALVILGDRILDAGPANSVMPRHPEALVVDAKGFVAIPGLINAHTHVAMGFFRGIGHGVDNMIEKFLFPAEKKLSPDLLEPLSYSYIVAGLKSGVTCFADHYYYSAGIAQAFERLGVRAAVGETVADEGGAFPTVETWTRAKAMLKGWKYSSRITPALAPHAADTVSLKTMKEIAAVAKSDGLPIHMHLSQTKGERTRVQRKHKMSPVAYARKAGVLSEHTLAVHMTSVTDDDLKIIAKSGATIGFCPVSQIIYEQLAPAHKMLARGIPLAVGTDCAASNDHCDMLSELKFTALLLKDRGVRDDQLSAQDVLAMATTQPAKVFGLKQLGTLTPKSIADVVFLEHDVGTLPGDQPAMNLLYSMGSRNVRHVMIDGQWVVWNRELAKVSEAELTKQYLAAVGEIKRRIGFIK